MCDSQPQYSSLPSHSHRIQNIVSGAGQSRKKTWWQSENGKEFASIQLDLEAEFHFTHLIITFKTFRPSAMLIERSYDFGKTWKVYRYFAYDCAESYPHVPLGPPRSISNVICEYKYSGVAPSTEGEVIFRVLPPNLPINDPYSPEVQELLKMTNLRINFTRLHTLGDNLLDQRDEIKEKYYYAIYDMVVRGSCSCYGHASRCVPIQPGHNYPPDMVHGKCECQHHTKGKNCELCEDFYNDLPWKPGIGHKINACKQCSCNNHATRCHFDPSVFKATGNVSGGVCDNCEHNTMGYHCEFCRAFFYHDPAREISDHDACQPCDCDPRGSLDEGICDSHSDYEYNLEAGRCHCKTYVEGRRCDRCENGYWNFQASNPDGCEPCTCNSLGTVGNQGCNQFTGECTCKRYVTGRDCNQCMPEHWGLSEDRDGCRPCDCDVGGAYDNNCDVISGQCRCRPHVVGRRCDRPEQGYFAGLMDYLVYEAELGRGSENCQVVVREPYSDRESSWSGLGFMRVYEGSSLEFDVDNIQSSLEYDIVVRYEPQAPRTWDDVRVVVERPGPIDNNDRCANTIPQDDRKQVSLPAGGRTAVVYPPACLERGKKYKIKLEFRRYDNQIETPTASVLIDSIVLVPRADSIPFFQGSVTNEHRRQEFEHARCSQLFGPVVKAPISEICKKHLFSIGFYVYGEGLECGCDLTGSTSAICDSLGGQCTCKANIVGRRCDRCAPGTYGFGPSGCRACDCNSIGSLDNLCDSQTGQCKCRQNTYGRQCDECQPGYWNYPTCQRCDCHGHADTCDSRSGHCVDCRDYSSGPKCDRCEDGYYGDPRIGVNIPCRPCPCPGLAESGHSYATTCYLDPRLQTVICNCEEGYAGERCDRCANNYFGNPENPGGKCNRCDCNNNIDVLHPNNCNARTGECLQCLFNTAGFNCERCKTGYYGDAIHHTCQECVCNILGTNISLGACDRITGQCNCLPRVTGKSCDRCEDNHWKIASGEGCERCDCDSGAYTEQCNEFDGQCQCKPGFGGRKCDQCQTNYWGIPSQKCYPCECNREGSTTLQCNRNNGTCNCLPGIGGDRCNQCARGHTGDAPYCTPCGECFDNWDVIIQRLKDETYRLIELARRINQTGSTGAYLDEFNDMEKQLDRVRELLANANITNLDIGNLQKVMDQLKQELSANSAALTNVNDELDSTTQRITDAKLQLNDLRKKKDDVDNEAKDLKEEARKLQLADVDGALNITRDAHRRSVGAKAKVDRTEVDVERSQHERKRTENLIEQGEGIFNRTFAENEAALNSIGNNLDDLEDQIPDLNTKVCDGHGDPCDPLCGGAGCNKCGGLSCDQGAITKADNALGLAEDADKTLREKEKQAAELQNNVAQAKKDADQARDEAQIAYDKALAAKNQSEDVKVDVEDLLDRIEDFLESGGSRPSDIRTLAEEVLNKSISLDPGQIRDLARQINDTIASLTDIDKILAETAGNLDLARGLKGRADRAKKKAEEILEVAQQVLTALDDARDAQDKAQKAIDKANQAIVAAEVDLTQIASETSAAQEVANKSVDDIEVLKGKLNDLKQKFVENERGVKKAANEATVAGHLANQAEKDAEDLEDKYNKAIGELEEKARLSGAAKDKAESIRNRANELAHNATNKLRELMDMEDEFNKNERRLRDLSDELDELNVQMTGYLVDIDKQSTDYRGCQT